MYIGIRLIPTYVFLKITAERLILDVCKEYIRHCCS